MRLKNASRELRNEETENLKMEEYFLQKWTLVSSLKQLTIGANSKVTVNCNMLPRKNVSGEYFHQLKVVAKEKLKAKNSFAIYLSRCNDLFLQRQQKFHAGISNRQKII